MLARIVGNLWLASLADHAPLPSAHASKASSTRTKMASQVTYYVLICGHHRLALPIDSPTITATTKINYTFDHTPCHLCRGDYYRKGKKPAAALPSEAQVRDITPIQLERVHLLHDTFIGAVRQVERSLAVFDTKIRRRFAEETLLSYNIDHYITLLLLCKDNKLRTRRLEARYHFSRFSFLIKSCKNYAAPVPEADRQAEKGRAVFFDFCRNEASKLYFEWKKGQMEIARVVEQLEGAEGDFDDVVGWLDKVDDGNEDEGENWGDGGEGGSEMPPEQQANAGECSRIDEEADGPEDEDLAEYEVVAGRSWSMINGREETTVEGLKRRAADWLDE